MSSVTVWSGVAPSCAGAPVVAGAAALLLQKDPTLSPDSVKARLMLTASKWADAQGNPDPCTYGAGYLDIPAAISCNAIAPGPAISRSVRPVSRSSTSDMAPCMAAKSRKTAVIAPA